MSYYDRIGTANSRAKFIPSWGRDVTPGPRAAVSQPSGLDSRCGDGAVDLGDDVAFIEWIGGIGSRNDSRNLPAVAIARVTQRDVFVQMYSVGERRARRASRRTIMAHGDVIELIGTTTRLLPGTRRTRMALRS